MFRPFSKLGSKRTCQDVLEILTQGSKTENIDGKRGSSSLVHHGSDDYAEIDPLGVGFHNAGESNPTTCSANPRRPGLRLGLKRVVVKTLGDGPPNKKERETQPLPKGTRCFSVLFAKPQTKKNKTWEEDGFLLLKDGFLSLKSNLGDNITGGPFVGQVLQGENCFSLGGKMVQVQEELFDLPAGIS